MTSRWLVVAAIALVGCKRPPPAPEGLDESTRHLVREFYADDATFGVGVQGFLDWYHEEGFALAGQEANNENHDAFSVGDLLPDDVKSLPLRQDLLTDPDGTRTPRDLTRAKGTVSLAEMDCSWTEAEQYLVRVDQNNVFKDNWEGYEREFLTSRSRFEDSLSDLAFDKITEPIDPFAEGFTGEGADRTFLMTDNMVDATPVLTINFDEYPQPMGLRHGVFETTEGPVGAMAVLAFTKDGVWGVAGANGLIQAFSTEITMELPDDRSIRILSTWLEPGGGIEPDSPLILSYTVNSSLRATVRLADICSGKIDLPPEP